MSVFDLPSRCGRVLLASGSPRRIELLREAGFDPVVAPQDVDETAEEGERPAHLVERLACLKAASALENEALQPGDVVIAADTIVAANDELLGKPADDVDAARMLSELSGNKHQVMTGVCIAIYPGSDQAVTNKAQVSFVETSDVEFYELSEADITAYVVSGEPSDKAGAYGIQGLGRSLVKRIDGDYFNIVGLPVARLLRELDGLLKRGEAVDDEDSRELSDESMAEVSGGIYAIPDPVITGPKGEIGYPNLGKLYYYPCPKCGKPMHKTWPLWFCDPCDSKYFSPDCAEWTGSEQALKDASA